MSSSVSDINKNVNIYLQLDNEDIIKNNYTINSNKQIIDLLEFLLSSLQLHIFKISKVDIIDKLNNNIIGNIGDEKYNLGEYLKDYLDNIENYIFKLISRKKNDDGKWEDSKLIEDYNKYEENKRNKYILEDYLMATRRPQIRYSYHIGRLNDTQHMNEFSNILTNFITTRLQQQQNNQQPDEHPDEHPDEQPDELPDEQPDEHLDEHPDELPDEQPDELELQEQELQDENPQQQIQGINPSINVSYNYHNHHNVVNYETMYDNIRFSYYTLARDIFNVSNNLGIEPRQRDVIVVGNKDEINNLEQVTFCNTTKKNKDCSVCLDELDDAELVYKIRCEHNFHCKCLSKWLKDYSNKCPICRDEIVSSAYLNM